MSRPQTASRIFSMLLGFGFVAAATGLGQLLQRFAGLPDPAIVFLTAVLFTAAACGLAASLVASVLSVLVYDFLFINPLFTFNVADPRDVVALVVFLIAAVLTSELTARVRRQTAAARQGEVMVALERSRVDAVLEEKAKTEQVIEAIEDGLAVLDPEGCVAHANEVACAILGLDRRELVGAPFLRLNLAHSHYLRIREAVREFLERPERASDPVEITMFVRGRDHHYVLRLTPYRTREGLPAGVVLALQDVTVLRDQEARRETLLSTLSHELRTPLTSLRMAIELLRQRTAAGSADSELVETAHEDSLRLQDVAERFLDLARTRATAIALERSRVEVTRVVSRTTRLFALQAREKGVHLGVRRCGDGSIVCDETKLSWALSNLIANAIRYTPPGGRVDVDIDSGNDHLLVSVSDTGPGIPPAQRERIFERYAQAAGGGEVGAAGLGLAIVRDIVQAHGGRIHLHSNIGQGARFTLELPRG